jgi:multidrug resistance efflux pump
MEYLSKNRMLIIFLLIAITIGGCDQLMAEDTSGLEASGVVEAVEVLVAPEVGGRVTEVFVAEGDQVEEGDPLISIENEILDSQYNQAVSAHEAAQVNLKTAQGALAYAEATLEAAQANLELAQIKYDLELMLARAQELPAREDAWNERTLSEFDLPVWYFDKSEEISAAETEVQTAWESLQIEKENLEDVLDSISNADLREAESDLAEAQAAFLVADELKDRRVGQTGSEEIRDYIQDLYDTAEAALESAQKNYDSLLSDLDQEDLLKARARVEVAQERYEIALDKLDQIYTGEESLQVEAAEISVRQAEAMVTQAEASMAQAISGVQLVEKSVAQAESAVDLIEIHLDRLLVSATSSGVVLIRNIEPGELAQAGVTVMTIGQLDNLSITVYVPEDRYGEIDLGDLASVTVDSFPNEIFDAVVTRIADQAEYTPRNVQTEEDRKTTVFAVELSVDDPSGKLKPGMPADVQFVE